MGLRRKARELAVLTIYALEYAQSAEDYREFTLLNTFPEILNQMANHDGMGKDHPALAFAEDLIKNTIIHLEEIENMLQKHSNNWSIERIVHLDRSILRIAIYEMLYTETPPPVIINEAIEIAKKYSSETANKFVNGILDAVHHDVKLTKQSTTK